MHEQKIVGKLAELTMASKRIVKKPTRANSPKSKRKASRKPDGPKDFWKLSEARQSLSKLISQVATTGKPFSIGGKSSEPYLQLVPYDGKAKGIPEKSATEAASSWTRTWHPCRYNDERV